jgi:predicted permease
MARWIAKARLRIRTLFLRNRVEQELSDELQFHLDEEISENLARGLSPVDARVAAVRRLGSQWGGVSQVAEECREARGWAVADAFLQDVKYALRGLRRAPLLACALLLTLAVGIGLDTGVFTIIDGLMLRPRLEQGVESYAKLYAEYSGPAVKRDYGGQVSLDTFRFVADHEQLLQRLTAWAAQTTVLENDTENDLSMLVTCNFFSVYGLRQARLGRLFRDEECAPGGNAQVAVISEELWQARFHADPEIIGKQIHLNRRPFTVIGIAPRDFSGRLRGRGVWLPYTAEPLIVPADFFQMHARRWLWLEGTMKPSVTRPQLAAELNVLAKGPELSSPDFATSFVVTNGAMIEEPSVRPTGIWLLLATSAGVTLLLLVACSNTAVLLLSRAAARRREIATRIALGAGRTRVLRMLLTETLVLASVAGIAGLAIAVELPVLFQKLIPEMPFYPFRLDWRVMTYFGAAILIATCMAGIAPARECLKQNVSESLKGRESLVHSGRWRWNARDLLIGVQISLGLVLIICCGFFARVELAMLAGNTGIEMDHVLQLPVKVNASKSSAQAAANIYRELAAKMADTPGVAVVAQSDSSPLLFTEESAFAGEELRNPGEAPGQGKRAIVTAASADYFRAIDLPIVYGTEFKASDPEGSTAIVSQSFAAAFWPQEDPIGKLLLTEGGDTLRIVAVARDTRLLSMTRPDGPHLYRLRTTPRFGDLLLVRFTGDAKPVAAAAIASARALDPDMLLIPVTLSAKLQDFAGRLWRVLSMLLLLAVTAGALAVLGVYGAVAFSVTRRMREFGIRVALGATRYDLLKLVLISGGRPVLAGALAGLLLALGAGLAIAQLFQQSPIPIGTFDPLTYGAATLLLLFAAIVSMLGHARRAARVEPMVALRDE